MTDIANTLGPFGLVILLCGCGGRAAVDVSSDAASDRAVDGDVLSGSSSSGIGVSGSGSGPGSDSMSAVQPSSGGPDVTPSICGASSQACCGGDQCQDTALWCITGMCLTCGSSGAPCCGTACNAGNVCVAVGSRSQCQACGQPGQPCCGTTPACVNNNIDYGCAGRGELSYCALINNTGGGQPGDTCTDACSGSDPSYACVSNGHTSLCVACGGLENPCCGTHCGVGLTCTTGFCQ